MNFSVDIKGWAEQNGHRLKVSEVERSFMKILMQFPPLGANSSSDGTIVRPETISELYRASARLVS